MQEVAYAGLYNGDEGCEVLQGCLEDAGVSFIVYGRGSVEELLSSLKQFSWFHRFVPFAWGFAFVPSGDDQVLMAMVSTPSGVAVILPSFNNPSSRKFTDEFIEDIMSLKPRWTTGASTLGATMSSALAEFLSEPRLVDMARHLGVLPLQEPPGNALPDAVGRSKETNRALRIAQILVLEAEVDVDKAKKAMLAAIAAGLPDALDKAGLSVAKKQPGVSKALGQEGLADLRTGLAREAAILSSNLKSEENHIVWMDDIPGDPPEYKITRSLSNYFLGPRLDAVVRVFELNAYTVPIDERQDQSLIRSSSLYAESHFLPLLTALDYLKHAKAELARAEEADDWAMEIDDWAIIDELWTGSSPSA